MNHSSSMQNMRYRKSTRIIASDSPRRRNHAIHTHTGTIWPSTTTSPSKALPGFLLLLAACSIEGFSVLPFKTSLQRTSTTTKTTETSTRLQIYAPPGSGYARPEDEQSELPSTYDPMMEYPGTMRPGRTPENMPFQDLPIGDNDPDPVPWPHFQQIEWHHKWEPAHESPIQMEDFIEMHGRWATPEMEAAMRAGVRQGVRERREAEEAEKREMVITDDEEDEGFMPDVPVALGDGVFGQLGSTADQAATAAATSPDRLEEEKTDEDETLDDGGLLDDFLLDLGLDAELEGEDDLSESSSDMSSSSSSSDQSSSRSRSALDDMEDEGEDEEEISMNGSGVTASIDVDDDSDLDLGLDEDDELEVGGTVPLESFGGDDSDTLDTEDIFDEGGFDFDDDFGDMDGGDMW